MFESSMNSKQFLKALERLRDQTKSSKPAALHNGVKRILERAKGFEGNKLDDLINFISSPPKPKSKSRSSQPSRSTKRPHTAALVEEIIEELKTAENDESAFDAVLKKFDKACTAKTIKSVASEYAASSIPKTKADAIELLRGERANRIRTERKMKESGQVTPW
ncbi:hypothetical protein [Henriciella mobilis]|nr:hypothetical protein [Henriciella mobilis]